MRNDDMQAIRNRVHLVHSPRPRAYNSRRTHPRRTCGRCSMYSRDRNRRT